MKTIAAQAELAQGEYTAAREAYARAADDVKRADARLGEAQRKLYALRQSAKDAFDRIIGVDTPDNDEAEGQAPLIGAVDIVETL